MGIRLQSQILSTANAEIVLHEFCRNGHFHIQNISSFTYYLFIYFSVLGIKPGPHARGANAYSWTTSPAYLTSPTIAPNLLLPLVSHFRGCSMCVTYFAHIHPSLPALTLCISCLPSLFYPPASFYFLVIFLRFHILGKTSNICLSVSGSHSGNID